MTITNSSLQSWLEFNGTLPNNLPPCFHGRPNAYYLIYQPEPPESATQVDCLRVCNQTGSLNHPLQSSLLTCGLWATAISSLQYKSDNESEIGGYASMVTAWDAPGINQTMETFHQLGFSKEIDPAYLVSVTELIGELLSDLLWSTYSKVINKRDSPGVCTKHLLFGPIKANSYAHVGYSYEERISYSIGQLYVCLDAICTAGTLNQDLAGVGVFSSYIIQIGIAIIAGISLMVLKQIKPSESPASSYLADVLTVSLVEFQRAQCCYAITIQIATFLKIQGGGVWEDIYGGLFILFSPTVGLIPVTFVLVCLCNYGRPSWYMKVLSLITYLSSSLVWLRFNVVLGIDINRRNNGNTVWKFSPAVPLEVYQTRIPPINALCGRPYLDSTPLSSPLFFWGVWASWAFSSFWMWRSILPRSLTRKTKHLLCNRGLFLTMLSSPSIQLTRLWMQRALFSGIWTFCFVFQLYFLAVYAQRSLISRYWTFSQIIAVTVWAPSLIEFAYILFRGLGNGSEYRYPPPWKTIKQA